MEITTKSIAVLPFVNMSNDKENEYFCDGITEEIINALTKIKGLKVTARTSSFAFKNKNVHIKEIGSILNVTNVLEETQTRIQQYENAGASGIFIPCIENEAAIKQMVETTKLPINVLCMPKLPNFNILKQLGVKRISMGNFLFDNMYDYYEEMTKEIVKSQSFNAIF